MIELSGLEIFLAVMLAGMGTVLFVTSAVAWKRTGSVKIGLVSMALLIFTIKGIYLSFATLSCGWIPESTAMLVLDISVIALIYFSILKG